MWRCKKRIECGSDGRVKFWVCGGVVGVVVVGGSGGQFWWVVVGSELVDIGQWSEVQYLVDWYSWFGVARAGCVCTPK